MSEHGIDIVLKARDEASEKLGNVQRSLSLLGRGFSIATAVRMGEYAAIAAYRAWGVEQEKVEGNYVGILQAELKLNDAMRDTLRAIPYIGRGAAAMMEAFGNDEGLRNSIKLVEELRDMTAQAAKAAKEWSFNARITGMQAAGRPASEIEALKIEQGAGGRQERIDELNKKIEATKQKLAEQLKREDAKAKGIDTLNRIYVETGMMPPENYGPTEPDREGSKTLRAEIAASQKERAGLEKSNREVAASDEQRLSTLKRSEADKISKSDEANIHKLNELKISLIDSEVERARAAVEEKYRVEITEARKAGLHLIEIDEMRKLELTKIDQDVTSKRADWEKSQQDKIAEMQLGFIKNKTEREIAAINLKYDLEIRKARESGMSTDSIERQRTIALELAAMVGPKSDRGPRFDERNMFRFGNGAGGQTVDYTQKTAASAEKQVSQIEKTNQLLQRIADQTKPNGGGQGLIQSNFPL